ncbi:hypothetical protein GGR58DRAFT_487317 [Xylaria digitata]|nr:hypothetical protein GGR58DRAFT_487317 [Xylaria digitata]
MASTSSSRIPVRAQPNPHRNSVESDNSPSAMTKKLHSLISSLSQKDRELLNSTVNGKDVLQDVLTNNEIAKSPRVVTRLRAVIEGFEPFFAAIDTASQADPTHFAVVWAGLRVIIQGITNLSTFFEKVLHSLTVMVDEMAYFSRVHEKIVDLSEPPKPIKDVLNEAYEQLLLYLIGIIRIFYRPTGVRNHTPRILLKAVWRPFRLDSTLATLKHLKTRFKDEMALLELGRACQSAKRRNASWHQEHTGSQGFDYGRHIFSERVRRWLAPPNFTNAFNNALDRKTPETCEWLAENASFSNWYAQPSPKEGSPSDSLDKSRPSFWIYGKPDAGKTVLAASLVSLLQNDLRDHAKCMVCYFFFDSLSPGNNRASDAYRAILAQIVQRRSDQQLLMDLFAFAMWSGSDGQLKASNSEVAELFKIAVGLLHQDKIYMILDGLDECADLETGLMLLLRLPQELNLLNLVCFSRDTVISYLEEGVPRYEIRIGQLNFDDIHQYFRHELHRLSRDQILPPDEIDFESVAKSLSRRSEGLFLWAILMVKYLRSPELSLSEWIEAISEINLPEGLDKMYTRILRLIGRSSKRAIRVKCILSWLYQSIRPVNELELEGALICDAEGVPSKTPDRFPNLKRDISTICGGLVEVYTPIESSNEGTNTIVKFIHSSVKEYLDNADHYIEHNDGVHKGLLPSPRWANAHLARVCLRYLTFKVPAQSLTSLIGDENRKSKLRDGFPLLEYALSFWAQHIFAAQSNEHKSNHLDEEAKTEHKNLLMTLHQFLSQPKAISAWIEATSIHGQSLPVARIKQLAHNLDTSSLPTHTFIQSFDILIQGFANYVETINENWSQHLLEDPICIWQEIRAFHPSKFNESIPGVSVLPLAIKMPSNNELWPKPVSNVSRMISYTTLDISISVFATKAFMNCYAHPHRHSELFKDTKLSSGWLLKVEVIDSKNAANIMNIDIPIDPHEVSFQLYQTLYLGSLHFPLSISPSGTHLACLRTIFTLTCYQPTLQYVTTVLSFHLNRDTSEFWSVPQDDDSLFQMDEYSRLRKPHLLSQVYLYWVYFDNHGRDVVVVEQARGFPIALNIFQLARTTPDSDTAEPTSVNRRHLPFKPQMRGESERATLAEKLFEVAFHPSLPILAIRTKLGVYIWDYLSQNPRSMISVISWQEDLDKIGFSSDGNTLFLRSAFGTTRVSVQEYLSQMSVAQYSASGTCTSASISTADTIEPNTLMAGAIFASLNPIRTNRVILPETTTQTQCGKVVVTMRNVGKRAELSLISGDDHQDINLTRIPNIDEFETIEPSAILPREGEEHIKLVLDQGPKTWHNLTRVGSLDDTVLRFPLVVSRDLSTLPQAQRIESLAEGDAMNSKGKRRQIAD